MRTRKITIFTALLLIVMAFKLFDYYSSLEAIRTGEIGVGDFYTYWAGAKYSQRFHSEDIYSEAGRLIVGDYISSPAGGLEPEVAAIAKGFHFYSVQSPLLYAIIANASGNSFIPSYYHFKILVVFCVLFFLAALAFYYRYPPDMALLLIFYILYVYVPLLTDSRTDNINAVQLALFSLPLAALSTGRRNLHILAGFLMGLMVFAKPNIFLAPVFLFLSRAVRGQREKLVLELSGFCAGAAAALAAGGYFFGSPGIWLAWLGRISSYPLANSPLGSFNYSLASIIEYLTGLDLSLPIGLVCVSLTGWAVVRLSKTWNRENPADACDGHFDCQIVFLGITASVLSSNILWSHYPTLILPLVFMIFSPGWAHGNKANLSWAAFAAFALLSVYIKPLPVILTAVINVASVATLFAIGAYRPYPAQSKA